MMQKNIKSKLEIGLVLMLALLISIFTARLFFINNTPQLNPKGAAALSSAVITWINDLMPKEAVPKTEPIQAGAVAFNKLEQVAFAPVAKGVSAREADGVAEIQYEVDRVTWKEYTFRTKEGQTITLKIPEGQVPPPQSLIDLLY